MALFLALVLLAGLAAIFVTCSSRRFRLASQIPGPGLWLPGVGSLLDFWYHYGVSGVKWCFGYHKRFGNVYRLWVGPKLFVVISSPDDIGAVVTSTALIDKGSNYALLRPWLGDGLLLLGGKKWHSRRKQLTPTFHFRILEQFTGVFNEKSSILESKLDALVGKGAFDVRPLISRHALDVICETAMGTRMNIQLQGDSEYVKAVKMACTCADKRHSYPWLSNDTVFRMSHVGRDFYSAVDIIHTVTRRVIVSRKAEMQSEIESAKELGRDKAVDESEIGMKKRVMFIDQLIGMHLQGDDLSMDDIFDEVNTFMFEGHDTTMTSVCFTLFLLSTHTDVQERAAEEILRVVGDSADVTPAHLAELRYLDAVVKESLRLYPSVPCFFRSCKADFKLPSGYTIPEGSTVLINAYMTHHDEDNFKEPFKFDPNRFLAEREGDSQSRHHYAYIPFSAGFRNCIGQRFAMMSMKTTLARLLRGFCFQPANDRPMDLAVEVVLTAKSGVSLVLQRRSDVAKRHKRPISET